MRNGLRPQPARSVRGSSRRIMSMRFRPREYQSDQSSRQLLRCHRPCCPTECSRLDASGSVFPLRRPSEVRVGARTVLHAAARVRFATPDNGVPLPAPRRSGQAMVRRAAPAGNTSRAASKEQVAPLLTEAEASPNKKRFVGGLTGSLHIRNTASSKRLTCWFTASCPPRRN